MSDRATSPEAVSESLWTVAETAHALHVSQTTVYRMAVREELPSVKIGRVL